MKNINDKIIFEDKTFPLEVPSEFPEELPPIIEEDDDDDDEDYSFHKKGSNYSKGLNDKYGRF